MAARQHLLLVRADVFAWRRWWWLLPAGAVWGLVVLLGPRLAPALTDRLAGTLAVGDGVPIGLALTLAVGLQVRRQSMRLRGGLRSGWLASQPLAAAQYNTWLGVRVLVALLAGWLPVLVALQWLLVPWQLLLAAVFTGTAVGGALGVRGGRHDQQPALATALSAGPAGTDLRLVERWPLTELRNVLRANRLAVLVIPALLLVPAGTGAGVALLAVLLWLLPVALAGSLVGIWQVHRALVRLLASTPLSHSRLRWRLLRGIAPGWALLLLGGVLVASLLGVPPAAALLVAGLVFAGAASSAVLLTSGWRWHV